MKKLKPALIALLAIACVLAIGYILPLDTGTDQPGIPCAAAAVIVGVIVYGALRR